MDLFDILSLVGGLSLFLFGMNLMGASLEKRAGGSLKILLGKLTSRKILGFLTGLGVTAVIQSSSATTVMVVGFVNSGLLSLKQAISVIMGANVGTTVTAWILSLTGLDSGNFFVQLLKPTSFTPVMALIGVGLTMMAKSDKKKDVGMILLGFAVLMFGMDTMSSAVAGLQDVPEFRNILLMFSNPVLGVLAGALLTAIIQSSSASVGILQALSATGQVTYGAAIPIIMGQNIGTCVTAMISSVGANKNARRAAVVHLLFNIVGTCVWLIIFYSVNAVVQFAFVPEAIDQLGIAVVHTAFNVLCTALLFPFSGVLEKLACRLIPDSKTPDKIQILDERLLSTPTVAIGRCQEVAETMARISMDAMKTACQSIKEYDSKAAQAIRETEQEADQYEDILGTYLVKLGKVDLSGADSRQTAKLLHIIGDFERISDHAVNVLESAEEMRNKGLNFSPQARRELDVLTAAVGEIMDLSLEAFLKDDPGLASTVEPLEQVVDTLKEQLRTRHILRLQKGECTIELGFVWSDLLTNLERVADHCSNIAGCIIEMSHDSLGVHSYLDNVKAGGPVFMKAYAAYAEKYALVE
ncbi:MAG: Na/Pi cotransporter family protein [Evtepia sp.]|uniref:Na/Pi cotransporter family protein n=1 Tax=Evtepia sp. TaxID=2773933 RepID=UPI002A74F2DC|nr:Na/Pi cotransporter family protein [Evtepia sp.]MDY3015504.1 Na/Pi cotransporter family protein [Evtepia sp.]